MAYMERYPGLKNAQSEKPRFENVIRSAYTVDHEEHLVDNLVDFIPFLFSNDSRKIEKAWTSIGTLLESELGGKFNQSKIKAVIDSVLRKIYGKILRSREQQHPDLHHLAINELKLIEALFRSIGDQKNSEIVRSYLANEYVPNRKQSDKILGNSLESFFNKILKILLPEQSLEVASTHREYVVLFSPSSDRKRDSWKDDGELVLKDETAMLYDDSGNLIERKTVDARKFVSAFHEGGIFYMSRHRVKIMEIKKGFEQGKDFFDEAQAQANRYPKITSFRSSARELPSNNNSVPSGSRISEAPNSSYNDQRSKHINEPDVQIVVNQNRHQPQHIQPLDGEPVRDIVDSACKLIREMDNHQLRNMWHNISKPKRSIILSEHFKHEEAARKENEERKRRRIASEELPESTFDLDEFISRDYE